MSPPTSPDFSSGRVWRVLVYPGNLKGEGARESPLTAGMGSQDGVLPAHAVQIVPIKKAMSVVGDAPRVYPCAFRQLFCSLCQFGEHFIFCFALLEVHPGAIFP